MKEVAMKAIEAFKSKLGYVEVKDLVCPRRAWYRYNMSLRELLAVSDGYRLEAGKVGHKVVLRELELAGCTVEKVVEWGGHRFRVDAICRDEEGEFVVEIKTGTRNADHDIQIKLYMMITGIKRGLLIYPWGFVVVKADDRELEELRKVAELSILYLDAEREEDVPKNTKYCMTCPFKNRCGAKLL